MFTLHLRQYPEAFDVLLQLAQEAPAWLQNQPMAKDLLAAIIGKRRTLTPQMREVADAIRLPL
jgi:hypothetical protein